MKQVTDASVASGGFDSRPKVVGDSLIGKMLSKERVAGLTQTREVEIEARHGVVAHLHRGEVGIPREG